MKNIFVSIVIPMYNCEKYIIKTLESVCRQTYKNYEVILIDDKSIDNTVEVVKDFIKNKDKFKLYKNDVNIGVADTRNIGVKIARGEYVAYLDADDWWKDTKLQKQIDFIHKNNVDFVYTARELASENALLLNRVIHTKPSITYKQLLYSNVIPCSSVLIKRELLLQCPMKRSDLHEDYLQWLNILKTHNKAYGINEALLVSRMTPKGKSRNKFKSIKMSYGVYRELGIGEIKSIFYIIINIILAIFRYYV